MKKDLINIFLILLFSLLGLQALLHTGLYTAHDIWHQVARIFHYQQAISEGAVPPYWISNMANGYGYPLFFFSYNLPWILGLPFLKLGFDIPNTLKILFFMAYFCSGLSMYFFSKIFLKNRLAGLTAAVLYLWAPYHFLTILVSAAIGIVFTFVFVPLLLLGIDLITSKDYSISGIILISFSILGIILSHLLTSFSLIPLILIFSTYILFKTQAEKRINFLRNLSIGVILGITLSGFYLVPAVAYSKSIKASTDYGFSQLYKHNFINFKQLIYSKWGYGPIINDARDGEISFQLGIAQWISIGTIFILLFTKISQSKKILIISILVAFSLSVAMMLNISRPIWNSLSKIATFDYPTRFMLPITFLGSFAAAVCISFTKNRPVQLTFAAMLVLVSLYANRNHIRVNLYTNIPVSLYVASETTTSTYNEYLPMAVDSKLLNKPFQVAEGKDLKISDFFQNTQGVNFNLYSPMQQDISIGQFYFPGITTYLNGKQIKYSIDNQGRVRMPVQKGSQQLKIRFGDTALIKISKSVTALGLLVLFGLYFGEKFSLKLLHKKLSVHQRN